MGRVGDGGGLRLEREKESGQEAGRISSRRLSPTHRERATTRMLHADRPARRVATCNNPDTVLSHSPSISKKKNEHFFHKPIFLNMEVMPPKTNTNKKLLKSHLKYIAHFSADGV